MTKDVAICESLLALVHAQAEVNAQTGVSAKSGSESMVSCLEFLARRCLAVEAAIEIDDLKGNIEYPFAWADDTVVDGQKRFVKAVGERDTSRTEVIELRVSSEGRTVLVINARDQLIPDAVISKREVIRSFLCLVLDRALLEKDREARAQRSADTAELGADLRWEMDAAGRYTCVSDDLAPLGLDPNNFLGLTFAEIGSQAGADVADADWKAMRAGITSGAPFRNFLHPALLRDGSKLWLRSSGKPKFDKDGIFLGYVGTSSEITDLVEGERSARDLAERFHAILKALPDLVFEITPEGKYTDFIAGPPDLMAGDQESLPGKLIEDVLPADVAAITRNAIEAIIRDGKCPPVRYKLKTAIGWHWFETAGARKPAAQKGDAPTAILVIRDVTDDVRQQEEISRLGKIVESMTNLVAIVDPEQRILWVNKAWERRTGWTLDEVRGRDLATLVRSADANLESAKNVADAIKNNVPFHGETVNCDRHGNRYSINFNIMPLFRADGSVQGYVSIETDITQQKESSDRIQRMADSEQKMRNHLQNAIEALPDGVVIWDSEERLIAVNSAYGMMYPEIAEMLVEGVSQDEILRASVERGAIPEALGRVEEFIKEQHERFKTPSIDKVFRPDGRCIKRLDLRTSDGGRIAVRIDTTRAQQQLAQLDSANRALDDAQRSLNRIIESADVGTWEWDVETDGLRIGGRYAAMLGYTPEELGTPSDEMFRRLVHPDDMVRLDSSEDSDYQATLHGDEPVLEHELRMRHKDGSWKWVLSRSAVAERAADGSHKKVVGIHLNVTDRKRLEDELRNSQTYMLQVMDGSISAITVLDEDGAITYANAEAERVLGMGRSAIKGRAYDAPVWGISAPDGKPLDYDKHPFRLAMDSGGPVRDVRMAIDWPNGTRQILSVNAAPYRDANGKTHVISSFVNITEEILKTELLEMALSDARQASRSKSSFLANMSHEIRTPLNGVLGMAEVLDGLITELHQKEMIGTIRKSGEMLLNVLNEILDMSKIEAGKMEIETVPFIPSEIVSSVEPLHRLRAEEKGIELDVLTNKGADLTWMGDQFRIQQILNNLLSNAIKFTDTGVVSLSVSVRAGKPLVIEVRDTGIGMTSTQVDRVFLSFEQAESGTTRRFGGTGLGMAIVRKLIDLMGGDITIDSFPGRGTTIRVSIPLEQAAAKIPHEVPAEKPTEVPQLTGVRILAADDSAINRQVLQIMLGDTRAQLIMVTNGAEAVAEWKRMRSIGQPADMLILDISMPVLDGVGALSAIRLIEGAGHQVPAIAVTANAMSHQVSEYIMAGFDAHVPKPYPKKTLLHAITTLLPGTATATA